jgi:hypothetical protein
MVMSHLSRLSIAVIVSSFSFRQRRLVVLGKKPTDGGDGLPEEPLAVGSCQAFGAELLLLAVGIYE